MTGLTLLIVGAPFALFRFAFFRFRKQSEQVVEVEPVEYVEAWPFDEIRARHPWLGEMEVRP